MSTIVGLELSFDVSQTGTANLFRQTFGRWPDADFMVASGEEKALTKVLEKLLLRHIMRFENGDKVCLFFGICCERSDSYWTDDDLKKVEAGLQKIREEMRDEMLILFHANSHNELRILDYCHSLLDKLQVYYEKDAEEAQISSFLETATIEDLGLSTRTYNALDRHKGRRFEFKRDKNNRVLVKSVIYYSGKELAHQYNGVKNFGVVSLHELTKKLAEYGLHLRDG